MSWNLPTEIIHNEKGYNILAGQIADTIAEWLNSERILEEKGRAVTAGDIMILVRKRTDSKLVDALFYELKKQNIPCMGMDRMKLTDHIAVMDLLALAKFLLLPQDDLNLACVLKSPLIDISEEQLFNLCYQRGDKTLWQRVKGQDKETAEYLTSLLNIADFTPPYELFSHILQGRYKKMASRLGEDINDPINEFLNLALEYENKHTPSLQGFIHWIERGDIVIKRDMEQSRDEVRILTVHGSKGLQSPIVILPDTAKLPSTSKMPKLLWQDEYPLYSPSNDECNELARERKDKVIQKQIEEYRRLLYVAMTRSEDELYICTEGKTQKGSWYELVSVNSVIASELDSRGNLESLPDKKLDCRVANAPRNDEFATLPSFITNPAPKEPTPSNPLSPSKFEEMDRTLSPLEALDNKRYERGTVIHKLLQYLPDINPDKRQKTAEQIAKNSELSKKEQEEAVKNAFEVLAQFEHIFINSLAEVSISGVVDDRAISGQIDRLIIEEERVIIIDFKTNRIFSDEIVKKYEKQMALYRKLLSKIYPDKEVETYLLWTELPKMVKVVES